MIIPSVIVSPGELEAHPENYNTHPDGQVEELVESLDEFGQFKNIVIWSPEEEMKLESGKVLYPGRSYILAGHGLWMAAVKRGLDEIEVKRFIGSYEQGLLLMKVDNAAPLGSVVDKDKLASLMAKTRALAMQRPKLASMMERLRTQNKLTPLASSTNYTRRIESPVYEPTGQNPHVDDLYDFSATEKLLSEIEQADLPEEVKLFLNIAAYRHTVINFKLVAEYYAHAEPCLQELMEASALVILDFDRAIELGFLQLTNEIVEMVRDEYGDE